MKVQDRMAQASEWFLRLRDEPVTEDIIEAWSQWCGAHPDNARCYRQVQRLWSLAGDAGMAGWPDAAVVREDDYDPEISISEWRRRQTRSWAPGMRRRWMLPVGLAATVLAGLAVWQLALYMTRLPATGVYSAERGEKRELRLADGSLLTLGGASVVRVAYGEQRREIFLEQGEAFFHVEPDRNRPFVVSAPELRITALGTAFAVRADAARTVVSVTEGLVEVLHGEQARQPRASGKAAQPHPAAVRAKAGEQVTFDADSAQPVLRTADVSAAIGWQDGAFVYVDEPLRSVIARINRYSARPISLGDGALGELRFTGTVFEHQMWEWARGLERVFPVAAARDEDGAVSLTWRGGVPAENH